MVFCHGLVCQGLIYSSWMIVDGAINPASTCALAPSGTCAARLTSASYGAGSSMRAVAVAIGLFGRWGFAITFALCKHGMQDR